MKKHLFLSVFLILFTVFLSACGMIPQPTPTATATPVPTDTPTPTLAPTSTATPEPTSTPTVEPTLALGEITKVKEGGYSFRQPLDYKIQIQGPQVLLADDEKKIFLSVVGVTSNSQYQSPDEIVNVYVERLFQKFGDEFEKGDSNTIKIGGIEGQAYEITGTFNGSPVVGQAVAVMPGEDLYLFGFGLAYTDQDEKQWEGVGSKVFDAVLNSITFLPPEEIIYTTGSCVVPPIKPSGTPRRTPSRWAATLLTDLPAKEPIWITCWGPTAKTYYTGEPVPFPLEIPFWIFLRSPSRTRR